MPTHQEQADQLCYQADFHADRLNHEQLKHPIQHQHMGQLRNIIRALILLDETLIKQNGILQDLVEATIPGPKK